MEVPKTDIEIEKEAREESARIPVATSDAEPAAPAAPQKPATAAPTGDPPLEGTPPAAATEAHEGGDGEGEGRPAASKKNDAQKRIDRLTRNWRGAEREAAAERGRREQLEQENERLRKQSSRGREASTADGSDDDSPKPEDFDNLRDWSRAFAKWELEKPEPATAKPATEGKEPPAPAGGATGPEINIKISEAQVASLKLAREQFADFDEVIADGMTQLPAAALVAAHDYDNAPELLYALVEAGELERFKGMSDRQVQREVWKFAESRSTATASSEKPQATANGNGGTPPQTRPTERAASRAGPIPTTVSGNAPADRSYADLAANDIGSFIAKRNADDAKAGYR